MILLEIKNITKKFSGLVALNDVSFNIEQGVIHGLIGPNGAGKSTLFKNIAGFMKPDVGQILYKNENITGLKPHQIVQKGIARTFQETTLFNELSVLENVLIGCHLSASCNLFEAVFRLQQKRQTLAQEKALDILKFMGLLNRKEQFASELPLGLQRALAIAIALASEADVLLLDEPFAGMNPEETQNTIQLVRKIQTSGKTIVLVEHDMKAVMELCNYLTVLNFGSQIAEGTPQEVRTNPKVIEAYLGTTEV